MTELNFDLDRAGLIEYVMDKIYLAEAGDKDAIGYLEFLWDHDPELLEDAQEAVEVELGN